jgi:hypothetical protein
LTHTIGYTIDGLLETGEALGDQRFVAAAKLAADAMLDLVAESPWLPARLDEEWRPRARYVCVTGAAQLGGILMKLHGRTGEPRYRDGALALVEVLSEVQRMAGPGRARRGGLPGSFPIWGAYAPLKLPSWGVKYHLDLLLLVQAAGGDPPAAPTAGAAAPAGAG